MNNFLSFFHGRKTPDEHLEDWGSIGPIVGPVKVSWTYGSLKLHPPNYSDIYHIQYKFDLVPIEGFYYGDFEILDEEDGSLQEKMSNKEYKILTLEEFKKLNN